MRTAIIVDSNTNESLLRFTEAKLFFDSKNVSRDLVDDCIVVQSNEEAQSIIDQSPQNTYFIIPVGAFLTSSFERKYKSAVGAHWISLDHELVIPYDSDTYIGFKKKCKYPLHSKQLYIVENMLKSILAAKKNIYVENTERIDSTVDTTSVKHLFGLASGWKTAKLANQIGLENLETVTVYDSNPLQLEWAKKLHSFKQLPDWLELPYNHVGDYSVPEWTKGWWETWHNYPVEFCGLDLLSAPVMPENSLIWISNVFKFEPLIFLYGWERLKQSKKLLHEQNKHSIIFEY